MEASRSSSDIFYYFGHSEEGRKPYAISHSAMNYLTQHYDKINKDYPFYIKDSILEKIVNDNNRHLFIFNFKGIICIKCKSEIDDVDAFFRALCPK